MAKIKKSRKQITIKFENKRESANFLAAFGFKHIPSALDESGPTPVAGDGACAHRELYPSGRCVFCLQVVEQVTPRA